jgi:hypothetical protein
MRYRVAEYTISGQTIALPSEVTIEDIRLIVNETQKKVICSSMQKSNVEVNGNTITVSFDICVLQPTDKLTIEIDKGEETAKEQTLTDGVNTLAGKIDNIKLPEIDTTNIASKDLERFFGVKPIEGYEFMTAEEICAELEEIMTSMDLGLTQEQAKEITNNTLNKG